MVIQEIYPYTFLCGALTQNMTNYIRHITLIMFKNYSLGCSTMQVFFLQVINFITGTSSSCPVKVIYKQRMSRKRTHAFCPYEYHINAILRSSISIRNLLVPVMKLTLHKLVNYVTSNELTSVRASSLIHYRFIARLQTTLKRNDVSYNKNRSRIQYPCLRCRFARSTNTQNVDVIPIESFLHNVMMIAICRCEREKKRSGGVLCIVTICKIYIIHILGVY